MKRDYDYIVIWIWLDGPCFYSLPIYGEAGVRLAQDVAGHEAIVDTCPLEPDPIAQQRVEDSLKQYLPTAHGPTIIGKIHRELAFAGLTQSTIAPVKFNRPGLPMVNTAKRIMA